MGLRFPWRFGLRARILRAKLKHNISASTRNSISRREGRRWGGASVELVHRPPSNIPPLAHPLPLLAAPVWQMFNITWKFWVAPTILVRGICLRLVHTWTRTFDWTPHRSWKGSWTLGGNGVCVCVSVWPRDQQTTRVNIFGAYVTSDLRFSHDRFKVGLLSRLAVFVLRDSSNHLLIRELCCAMERDF